MAIGAATGGWGATAGKGVIGTIAQSAFGEGVGKVGMALTGAALGGAAAVATDALMPPEPMMPDYGMAFGQQQAQLDSTQSFQRKNTADLEYLLEHGSTFEKNRAFEELEGRGEDAARLLEIQTRRDRTDENQADIDRYIESTSPPSQEDLKNIAATLYATESQDIKEEVDETYSQLTQVMARQGMGSSNKARQLQAELAKSENDMLSQLRKDVDSRVLNYAQGVSTLQDQGLSRMLRGAGYEDTATRYNLAVMDQERALNQGLRNSNIAQRNALGLEKFRADIQGMNNKFAADTQTRNNAAMLGLGALGLGMDYFKDATSTTTPTGGEKGNSWEQPNLDYTPSSLSFGHGDQYFTPSKFRSTYYNDGVDGARKTTFSLG